MRRNCKHLLSFFCRLPSRPRRRCGGKNPKACLHLCAYPTATEAGINYDNNPVVMRARLAAKIRDIISHHASAMANDILDSILGLQK